MSPPLPDAVDVVVVVVVVVAAAPTTSAAVTPVAWAPGTVDSGSLPPPQPPRAERHRRADSTFAAGVRSWNFMAIFQEVCFRGFFEQQPLSGIF
jgi:hypothetical protein